MTAYQHNKIIGIIRLVLGSLTLLFGLGIGLITLMIIFVTFGMAQSDKHSDNEAAIFIGALSLIYIVMFIVVTLLGFIQLIAGYKQTAMKPKAKIWGIVCSATGFFNAFEFFIGIYFFIVFFIWDGGQTFFRDNGME